MKGRVGIRLLVALVVTATLGLAAASSASGALVGDYRLTGEYRGAGANADDFDSATLGPLYTFNWPTGPLASENVAGCTRETLPFAAGQGGTISTEALFGSDDPYSIIVQFRFDEVASYRRVINWSASFSVENGLYIHDGRLTFYDNNDPGPSSNHEGTTVISPGEYAEVAITRETGGEINTYVNGIHQVTYLDAAAVAVSTHPAGNVYFFRDNDVGPGSYDEESAGAVARIRVYDEVLPAGQISNTVGCFGRRCGGSLVTIDATAGDDVIVGTQGRDIIDGLEGNDTIRGLGGRDILCGGAGRDKLLGGKGKDRLLGGAGKDRVIGSKGRDTCRGGMGRDVRRGCERGRG